ncbi:MAG TPA: acyltransferase domain-containing protein [Pirellulales bacterium]|nr:acyltransferase domain-containing protein [Pirellulales bacterium]
MDPTVAHSWALARIGAIDSSALQAAVAAQIAAKTPLSQAVQRATFSLADRCHAVIVAGNDGEFHARLRLLADHLATQGSGDHLEAQGVFLRLEPLAGSKVAWLFPGQGSQYPNMLAGLAEQSPAAAALLAEADSLLRSWGEMPWPMLAAGAPDDSPRAIWNAQISMLLGDLALAAALHERGLTPDAVSGHSYGEFAALVAAGAWTLADAMRATRVRTAAIARVLDGESVLVSTNAPGQAAEQIVREMRSSGSTLTISHYNAPNQTVFGGSRKCAACLAERLQSAGFESRPLAVPVAYHTPLLADAQPLLAVGLEAVDVRAPHTVIYSNVTNRRISDPREVRQNLVEQLVAPVRYQALVEQLVADGYGVLIEVGAGQVLTQLNRRIVTEANVVCISADHPRRTLAEQFARLEASLDCAGLTATAPVINEPRNGSSHGRAIHATATPRANRPLCDRAGLEEFLRDFVISQTGFPPEVVEPSADFEADLGIDSIERVKMFGELRDLFDLTEADLKSLEQVRTIADVVDCLANDGPGNDGPGNEPGCETAAVVDDAAETISRMRGRADISAATLATLIPSDRDAHSVRHNGAAQEWLLCEALARQLQVHPGNVLADRAARQYAHGQNGARRPR